MEHKVSLHLDDIIFNLQQQGGISRYWKEITSRIVASKNFQVVRTQANRKFSRYLPVQSNCQVFHSSYYRKSLSKKTKLVVTVHDFIYQYGFVKSINGFFHIWQMNSAINNADAIICVSKNTQRDLFSFYPNLKGHPHIYVIPNGANLKPNDSNSITEEKVVYKFRGKTNRPYILFVGRRSKYKNFDSALSGFLESSLVKQGFSLICVGSPFTKNEISKLRKLNLQDNVFVLTNLTDQELIYLYENAFALVYPSLYEGFGIPPLEAMNLGCPVIASNCSSIPEVVGDAGILIKPLDIDSIASSLDSLLNEDKRIQYIQKGLKRATQFDWDKSAQQYMDIYKNLSYGVS